eukprot:657087-Rhodomonas_salina.3
MGIWCYQRTSKTLPFSASSVQSLLPEAILLHSAISGTETTFSPSNYAFSMRSPYFSMPYRRQQRLLAYSATRFLRDFRY